MIEVRSLDSSSGSCSEVRRFLNDVFPSARHITDPYLDWCYNRNPGGAVLAMNAYSDGQLVGHLAGQPIRARLDGEEIPGLLAIHNALRAGYRGRKINAMILDAFLDRGAAAGYQFVIGFTNAHSRNFVARRLPSFEVVCSLDAKIGIGSLPQGGDRTQAQFARVWDRESLAWRLARPGARYRMRTDNDQRIVSALTDVAGIAVELGRFHPDVCDFELPRPPRLRPGRLWIGLDAARDWSGRAYMKLPNRFRPSPLAMVFSDLSGRRRKLDVHRVHIDAIDLDAF